MTAGQRVIAQPALQGRIAAAALTATFAIGVLTGLVAPLVRLPAPAIPAVATVVTAPSGSAYLSYRQGERGDPIGAAQLGDPAWLTYRQGERADSPAVGSVQDPAWQLYRAGERGDSPGYTAGYTPLSLAAQSRAEAARHHPPAP